MHFQFCRMKIWHRRREIGSTRLRSTTPNHTAPELTTLGFVYWSGLENFESLVSSCGGSSSPTAPSNFLLIIKFLSVFPGFLQIVIRETARRGVTESQGGKFKPGKREKLNMRETLLYLVIGVQSYGSPGFFQKLQVAPEGKCLVHNFA